MDPQANGCINCTSHALNDSGYPIVKRDGKCYAMYRYVYQAIHGPVDHGTVIRHTCDNRLCVNVDHLVPGTHEQNVADRVERNRSARGQANGRAKLTPDQVREILASSETPRNVADRFGIDPKTVRQIRERKIWRHLN